MVFNRIVLKYFIGLTILFFHYGYPESYSSNSNDMETSSVITENYGKTHNHSPILAKSVISLHSSSEIPLSSLN